MWSWGADGEPERGVWYPQGARVFQWRSRANRYLEGVTATEGETVFPTREAAIRHAIEQTESDVRVMEKSAEVLREKLARLMGMLEGVDEAV